MMRVRAGAKTSLEGGGLYILRANARGFYGGSGGRLTIYLTHSEKRACAREQE